MAVMEEMELIIWMQMEEEQEGGVLEAEDRAELLLWYMAPPTQPQLLLLLVGRLEVLALGVWEMALEQMETMVLLEMRVMLALFILLNFSNRNNCGIIQNNGLLIEYL